MNGTNNNSKYIDDSSLFLRKKKKKNLFSKLAYKIKTNKNHVMDGYQKGHMAIQAGGLKKNR